MLYLNPGSDLPLVGVLEVDELSLRSRQALTFLMSRIEDIDITLFGANLMRLWGEFVIVNPSVYYNLPSEAKIELIREWFDAIEDEDWMKRVPYIVVKDEIHVWDSNTTPVGHLKVSNEAAEKLMSDDEDAWLSDEGVTMEVEPEEFPELTTLDGSISLNRPVPFIDADDDSYIMVTTHGDALEPYIRPMRVEHTASWEEIVVEPTKVEAVRPVLSSLNDSELPSAGPVGFWAVKDGEDAHYHVYPNVLITEASEPVSECAVAYPSTEPNLFTPSGTIPWRAFDGFTAPVRRPGERPVAPEGRVVHPPSAGLSFIREFYDNLSKEMQEELTVAVRAEVARQVAENAYKEVRENGLFRSVLGEAEKRVTWRHPAEAHLDAEFVEWFKKPVKNVDGVDNEPCHCDSDYAQCKKHGWL